ncbi:MAG TPA: hypothetical protein VFU59_00580, partial [Candidatus Eisenbacteria bacterium]|nr:hypothetical protein [Candidatus Eisenbacteria bacterium]
MSLPPPTLPDVSDSANRGAPPRAASLAFLAAAAAAILYALVTAFRQRWVSDDAFISFRYAENLVRGLGLVYNPGERVEGYSNFTWTLWSALGMRLGVEPEKWSSAGGIACYVAALALLAWNAWTYRRESSGLAAWIPLAAILGALHPDWQLFATGGLETSLFALEITALYLLLARGDAGPARAAAAGLLLGLAAMTRPDGPIFVPVVGLFLLLTGRRRLRALLALGAAFLLVWTPYTLWRVGYYGDYFPNTYYAKSAAIPWYSQGAFYVSLYFARYWPLLLAPVLVAAAWRRRGGDAAAKVERESAGAATSALSSWQRRALLAAMLVAVYVAFVIRVGGDFMFARFLIPVTPLLLVLLELGIARVALTRAWKQGVLAAAAAAGIVLTPYPLPSDPFGSIRGIVFEPNFYPRGPMDRVRREGLALRPFFAGL